eukprot:2182449-Rhodomonas_salina.1
MRFRVFDFGVYNLVLLQKGLEVPRHAPVLLFDSGFSYAGDREPSDSKRELSDSKNVNREPQRP